MKAQRAWQTVGMVLSLTLTFTLFAACGERAQEAQPSGAADKPAASAEAKPAGETSAAAPAGSAAAPAEGASAPSGASEPAAGAKAAGFTCRIKSSGTEYKGPCEFAPDGGGGSFSITPVGTPTFGFATVVTVSVVEPGVADVWGLTADGINSRWGEAKRSTQDKACWTGSDFEVCAYAGDAPK